MWEAPLAEHGAVLWRERVRVGRAGGGTIRRAVRGHRRAGARGACATRRRSSRRRWSVAAVADALARRARAASARSTCGAASRTPVRTATISTLTLDGRELRAFGSAGQQRTAAIALRLLEAETLRERLGAAPLFLLDDPFAELDVRRSARILELLAEQGMGQTLLTVPRESDIPPALTTLARWRIAVGRRRRDDDAHAGAA